MECQVVNVGVIGDGKHIPRAVGPQLLIATYSFHRQPNTRKMPSRRFTRSGNVSSRSR